MENRRSRLRNSKGECTVRETLFTPNEESVFYTREKKLLSDTRKNKKFHCFHFFKLSFFALITRIFFVSVSSKTRGFSCGKLIARTRDRETVGGFGRELSANDVACWLTSLLCYLLACRPALAEEGGTAAAAARNAFRLSAKDDDLDGCWSTTADRGVVADDGVREVVAAAAAAADLNRCWPDLTTVVAGAAWTTLLPPLLPMTVPAWLYELLAALCGWTDCFDEDLAKLVAVVLVVVVVVFGTVDEAVTLIVTLGLTWWWRRGRWGGALVARKARTHIVHSSEVMTYDRRWLWDYFYEWNGTN